MKVVLLLALLAAPLLAASTTQPTRDDGTRYLLTSDQLAAGKHHTRHAELFSRGMDGFNVLVLRGIDKVQASAPEGGGYFIGVKATPPESPIGYELRLWDRPLLKPPRGTSYCSGASYAAFIESMNLLFPDGRDVFMPPLHNPAKTAGRTMEPSRADALRMQEPDGGRREDGVKFWGHWNDNGPGCQYALVQYSKIGGEVSPECARPGDFMNISWKSGVGHSTVFLGWVIGEDGSRSVLYWASQKGTNGLGDQMSSIEKIERVKIVRLTRPQSIFSFDPDAKVNRKVAGDPIDWPNDAARAPRP